MQSDYDVQISSEALTTTPTTTTGSPPTLTPSISHHWACLYRSFNYHLNIGDNLHPPPRPPLFFFIITFRHARTFVRAVCHSAREHETWQSSDRDLVSAMPENILDRTPAEKCFLCWTYFELFSPTPLPALHSFYRQFNFGKFQYVFIKKFIQRVQNSGWARASPGGKMFERVNEWNIIYAMVTWFSVSVTG